MGFRKMHSAQVGLVLNLLTDSISPQYHVVFGDSRRSRSLDKAGHIKDPGHVS